MIIGNKRTYFYILVIQDLHEYFMSLGDICEKTWRHFINLFFYLLQAVLQRELCETICLQHFCNKFLKFVNIVEASIYAVIVFILSIIVLIVWIIIVIFFK